MRSPKHLADTSAAPAPAGELLPQDALARNLSLAGTTKAVHLWIGFGTAVVFMATGIYMVAGFPALHGGDEAVRYMYRANHVYLLLAGLINVLAGVYRTDLRLHWRGRVALAGSVLLWLAPFVLLYAFFVDPARAPLRPATFLGTCMLLIGVAAQWPNRALKSRRAGQSHRRGLRSSRRAPAGSERARSIR